MQYSTQINTLRIRGTGVNTPALRLAVSSQLGSGEFEPSSMPPSCLLFVHKIIAPLPRRFRPPLGMPKLDTAWERAVRNRLNECYQSAVRPENGAIPFNAEAILFQDEAEMLACLARDINLGQHLNRWWWKAVLSSLPNSARNNLAALFCYHAQQLPAILDYLDSWGEATSIVSSLDNLAVSSIMRQLVQEYQLNELLTPPIPTMHVVHNISSTGEEASTTDRNLTDTLQPWSSWLKKEETQGMSTMQSYLLGIGLGLFHHISRVRSSLFAAEIKVWWATLPTAIQSVEKHHASSSHQGETKDNFSDVDNQKIAAQPTVTKIAEFNSRSDKNNEKEHEKIGSIKSKSLETGTLIQSQSDDSIASSLSNSNDSAKKQQVSPKDFENYDNLISKSNDNSLANGVHTKLGGILYLINLLGYLELPDCFEEQCKLEDQVGIWGLVELLAKALLAEHLDSFLGDPIWLVLIQLEGREPQEIQGEGFQFSGDYKIPKTWLEMIHTEEGCYYWDYKESQLYIWSDAGFVLQQLFCKVTSEQPLDKQVANIFQSYFLAPVPVLKRGRFDKMPSAQFTQVFLESASEPLSTWMSLMLPGLQCRLMQALGHKSKSHDSPDFFNDLFFCPATLHITSTHIDLVSELKHISLPVRMAGLDRNPGWVPELGRVLNFHFN